MDQENNGFVKLILSQEIINDRFSPNSLISNKGHFSVLIKAYDQKLKKDVALKFFDPSKKTDEYRLKSFHRESELLGKLKGQKNIIELIHGLSVNEIIINDSNSGVEFKTQHEYIALELALSDIQVFIYDLADDETGDDGIEINAIEKLNCFNELCKAVNRIHKQNICHRDLKPDNFLICDNDQIKLSDLGTAVDINDNLQFISDYVLPVGDKRYCAPELLCCIGIRDLKAFAADIFSLGAILFEMFTKSELTLKIYSESLLTALLRLGLHNQSLKPEKRLKEFDKYIDSIITPHRLPDISSYNDLVPKCIENELNKLYVGMTHLNFRNRKMDFNSIFRQINICILLLKNRIKERHKKKMKYLKRENVQC